MSTKNYNVRSISLQARSHPTTLKIEHELNKLETVSSSSSSSLNLETIFSSLSSLVDLYKCIGDFLDLPLTQKALSQNEKWVNETLDGLLRYLEICSNTRDSILLMKESVIDLQSALRRSKCGSSEFSIESYVNAYVFSRKKMKKEVSKSLKQLQTIFEVSTTTQEDQHQYHMSLFRKVSSVTSSVLKSVLSFLSVPLKKKQPKNAKWFSLVSKLLLHKNVVESDWDMSELEALEDSMDGFEDALECLFRRLIQARVSLLNILSR